MTEKLDTSKVAAIALGMTECELKEAIEKQAIQAVIFLPVFAQQLQAELGEGK